MAIKKTIASRLRSRKTHAVFKRQMSLSGRQLIYFALIFSLIGGVIIYLSFAAPNPNLPGDLNNDNTVSVLDLSILLTNYGTSNSNADLNNDNAVNILDLSILLSHYGQNYTPVSTPTLGPELAVGSTLGGNQYQSDLRVDPNNSNHMAIALKTGTAENSTAVMTSRDGGATWTTTAQSSSGDSDVYFDNSGAAHWTFIDKASSNTLGYRKSTDGGQTWSAKVTIGPAVDHPNVFVDRTNSAYAGTIYAAGRAYSGGSVAVDYSRNGGTTWSTTVVSVSGQLAQGFVYGLTVLQDGTVIIPMLTARDVLVQNNVYAGTIQDIYVLRSTDGGQTFTTIHVGPNNWPTVQGAGYFLGLSNLAVGSNGAGGQRLYLTYVQPVDSAPSQLTMVTSDDGGLTWSAPVQIAPSVPTNWGAGPCSVMVNKNGVVGVQYYSISILSNQASPGTTNFDLYFVYSKNNGATFSAPLRISSVSSAQPTGEPRYIGHDQGYADVDSSGDFHLVWTDTRGSAANYTIYSRTVTVP